MSYLARSGAQAISVAEPRNISLCHGPTPHTVRSTTSIMALTVEDSLSTISLLDADHDDERHQRQRSVVAKQRTRHHRVRVVYLPSLNLELRPRPPGARTRGSEHLVASVGDQCLYPVTQYFY